MFGNSIDYQVFSKVFLNTRLKSTTKCTENVSRQQVSSFPPFSAVLQSCFNALH